MFDQYTPTDGKLIRLAIAAVANRLALRSKPKPWNRAQVAVPSRQTERRRCFLKAKGYINQKFAQGHYSSNVPRRNRRRMIRERAVNVFHGLVE